MTIAYYGTFSLRYHSWGGGTTGLNVSFIFWLSGAYLIDGKALARPGTPSVVVSGGLMWEFVMGPGNFFVRRGRRLLDGFSQPRRVFLNVRF